MHHETESRADVRHTITDSCIPLLCGSPGSVRRTARLLYRSYGLTSYVLLTGGRHLWTLLPLYTRRIPAPAVSAQLLARIAIRFFESLDQAALPVLIDCTEDRILLDDPSLRAALESRCFLSDPDGHTDIPPFCYLSPDTGESYAERSDQAC